MADQVRTLSVRQIMDSSDYARGAREFVSANQQMSQSSSVVGQIVTQTQVKISNAADGVTRLVRAYDPAAAAAVKFQTEILALNKQLEAGKIQADAAARVYAGIVQRFGMAADGADLLAQGLRGVGTIISNVNQQMLEFSRVSAAIESAAQELDQMTTAATRLRAEIDPIGASQAKLNAQLAEYGTLLRARAIDEAEFAKGADLARQRHEAFVASLDRAPGAANDNSASFRRTNLGYQAFDVGQGLASGMPLPMILAQQGPQIAQMYAMEGGAKNLVSDLTAARAAALGLLSSIGPLGWAFAGVTVAAGAFYLLTRTQTKTTDELLKEHAANIKALGDAYNIAEDKAKKFTDADRAIALAKAQTSTEELQKRTPESIDALFKQFGTPLVSQNGPTQFNITGIYAPFEQAFEHLKKTADPSAFVQKINDIGKAKGLEDLAKQIVTATENFAALKEQIDAANRSLLLANNPNYYGRTNEAAERAKQQAENAYALLTLQRQHAAELAGIGARSPQELADAARTRVMSQPIEPGEDPTNRQYRANAAAALAYAQAENQLKEAKEERIRQSDQEVAKAQYELSLIGQSVAERNRLTAAYEAEMQIRQAAAQAGVAADQKEIDSARAKAAAVADANAKISLGKMIEDQGYDAQRLQLEANLIGATADQRARATAALEAEIRLKQQGIELSSQAAQGYIKEQEALAQARVAVERQQQAYEGLQQAEGSAIDDILTGTGSLKDRLKAAASDMLKYISQLGANGVKNQLTGTNLPTLADLFAGKPVVPGATSTSTAAMTVTATSVYVNGAPVGGLPALPGTNTGGLAGLLGYKPTNDNGLPIAGAPVIPVQRLPLPGVIDRQDGYTPPYDTGNPLSFAPQYRQGTDPRLTDILNQAALRTPGYNVQAFSGYRQGDPRFHGEGLATDVRLIDPNTGKALSNYQDPATFRTYEQFAQQAKLVQMDKYPELNQQFRWGGYFSGPPGKYGAVDEMHFDLGGNRYGMAGGTWAGGLKPEQRAMFPGVDSQGLNQVNTNLRELSKTTTQTTDNFAGLGDSTKTLQSSFSNLFSGSKTPTAPTSGLPSNYFPPAPTTGAGFNPFSLFTSIFSLFGFADGTDFSPGGMAWVGERGRELVRLPRGSQVTPNHRLHGLANDNGPRSVTHRHEYNIVVSGNGDRELMERMHVAADEAARAHVDNFARNGFGDAVEQYRNHPYQRG